MFTSLSPLYTQTNQ